MNEWLRGRRTRGKRINRVTADCGSGSVQYRGTQQVEVGDLGGSGEMVQVLLLMHVLLAV